MPHAAPSLHPLNATGRQCAPDVVRVDVADRAFRDIGQGGDTRMGMQRPIDCWAPVVEKIEKHEGLQDLAQVGRTHEPRDGTVRPAAGTLNDRPRQAPGR